MTRLEEIEARLSAIQGKIDAAEGDALTALETETTSLIAERKGILDAAEQRAALRSKIAAGDIPAKEIEKAKENPKMEERTFGVDSVEYRNAWLKSLQHKELTEDEKRAYATSDTHTAIPTIVADAFFEELKKLAPMISHITLMRVAGDVKFIAQGTRNVAAKHTENSTVTAAADTIVSVTLGAFEFIKVIGISENAANMSVDAFQSFLIEMLSGDIARAIDNYIINDATNGIAAITYTTNTNQILSTQGYSYSDVLALCALIPAAYDAEAAFLVNKKTLYNEIASIVDSQGRPIFVPSTVNGVEGRLMGYPVLVDDYVTTANDALYLGRWKDVVGNLSKGIEVKRDESSGFLSATINYRGYAAFDSKVAKKDAIVRLVSTTA